MNPEIKARWTAALRSGEYQQSTEYLHYKNGYCCLGVLCELAVQDNIIPPAINLGDSWAYDGAEKLLPDKVIAWAGLHEDDPAVKFNFETGLAELNDDGHDFNELADLIDNHLVHEYPDVDDDLEDD
jgi:hypothetical protein